MKKYKALKIIGIILAALVLFFAVINIIPPKKNVEANPFVVEKGELPMIAAHRGGGKNNPENTMLAFSEAVNTIGIDIIESDLYLTKDGYLVYNHDSYIDETCNVNGDLSLDIEIRVSQVECHFGGGTFCRYNGGRLIAVGGATAASSSATG